MPHDLDLICHKCRQPIEGDTGSLRVTYAALHAYRDAERAYRLSHPEGSAVDIYEFLAGPMPVNWLPYHDRCDPEFDQDSYQIDAPHLRTWQGLCHWTAHLMEKNWFTDTDWDQLLRELAGDSQTVHPRIVVRMRSAA